MGRITDKQRSILQFISDYVFDRSYPPSRREILDHLGVASLNTIGDHLRALEAKGMLEVAHGVSRGIRVTPLGQKTLD